MRGRSVCFTTTTTSEVFFAFSQIGKKDKGKKDFFFLPTHILGVRKEEEGKGMMAATLLPLYVCCYYDYCLHSSEEEEEKGRLMD